jgi:hypothetical protein
MRPCFDQGFTQALYSSSCWQRSCGYYTGRWVATAALRNQNLQQLARPRTVRHLGKGVREEARSWPALIKGSLTCHWDVMEVLDVDVAAGQDVVQPLLQDTLGQVTELTTLLGRSQWYCDRPCYCAGGDQGAGQLLW